MSQNQLSPEESYNILVAQVHAPVFFEKLARVYSITPQTPDEARELLLMAGQLRNAHEQEAVKQANANVNFLTQASNDLKKTLENRGYAPLADQDANVKAAAAQAVQNPLLKEAALVFNNYLHSVTQGN